ncbi:NAD(P)-binding protein [Pleurostoma richardsiae]|uniref:NAD(P)-binding protein n=1 Tax=Pleurostoma richardsiae TaxID=41990 RepID=A0AA38VSB6_9PEZI|nr:NAD(P)-binding protein [Pleurostoma richardsiae]
MPAMAGYVNFSPDKDIPSLEEKVVLVTGGTAGLGRASIVALAKHNPAHIYFTGRNATAAQSLISDVATINPSVSLTFLEMDMTSLASVKAATKRFVHDRLDILMCNAGIMASPPGLSKDGFEMQFAVNHLGNAMVIQQVLPVLLRTAALPGADVRVVSLTSTGWRGHPKGGVLFDEVRTTQDGIGGSWIRYGQSKLANIVYAAELARRYPSILTVSVHPGVVETGLVTNLDPVRKAFVYAANFVQGTSIMKTEQGCYSQLWVAAGGKRDEMLNGAFYMPVGVLSNDKLDKTAKSQELAKRLWDWTADVLAKY